MDNEAIEVFNAMPYSPLSTEISVAPVACIGHESKYRPVIMRKAGLK